MERKGTNPRQLPLARRLQVLVTAPAWLESRELLHRVLGSVAVDAEGLDGDLLIGADGGVRVHAIGLPGNADEPATAESAAHTMERPGSTSRAQGAALRPSAWRATLGCALPHEVTTLPVWSPRKSI